MKKKKEREMKKKMMMIHAEGKTGGRSITSTRSSSIPLFRPSTSNGHSFANGLIRKLRFTSSAVWYNSQRCFSEKPAALRDAESRSRSKPACNGFVAPGRGIMPKLKIPAPGPGVL